MNSVVQDLQYGLLGTAPLLGRTFEAADFSSTMHAVVISHSLWRQRFAADHAIIGRTIQLGDANVEIVGVMPPEFELPTAEVQLWQPLWFGPGWLDERSRGSDALVVLGRLAPSATIASARAEMDAIAARLRDRYPASNASFGVLTDPLTDRVIGPTTERSLWLLFGSDFFIHRQPDYRVALEGQPPRRPDDHAPPLTEDQIVPGQVRP